MLCGSLAVQTVEFDEGAGAVLRIQPLRAPRDENVYECVARNSEGEVSVTAKLAIIRGIAHTLASFPPLHILPSSFSTRLVLSFHVHTPELSRHLGFPALSVVDVTIGAVPHPALSLQAVLFIVPSSARPSVIWPRTGPASALATGHSGSRVFAVITALSHRG